MRRFGPTIIAVLLGVAPAVACPVCASDTGRRVRAGVFDAEFGTHLALVGVPFAVAAGVATLIHFWPSRRERTDRP